MFDKFRKALIIESKRPLMDEEVEEEEERIRKETGRRVVILRYGYTLKDS
jgi:hypothetical protein